MLLAAYPNRPHNLATISEKLVYTVYIGIATQLATEFRYDLFFPGRVVFYSVNGQ